MAGTPKSIAQLDDNVTITGTDYIALEQDRTRRSTLTTFMTYVGTRLGSMINAATAKTTPVDADSLPIQDSANSNNTKQVTWANVKATLWTSLGALINGGTSKSTPVDADSFPIQDSAASAATKQVTLTNLATYMGTKHGPVGAAITGKSTPIDADSQLIIDSAASNATKKTTFLEMWNNYFLAKANALYVTISGANQTISGRKQFITGATGNNGIATATSSLGEIEIRGNGTGAAYLAFHRPSAFAAYLGIDTDNAWAVGGWSHGAVRYKLYHEGFKPTKSDVGLGSVDNTADSAKSVSAAVTWNGRSYNGTGQNNLTYCLTSNDTATWYPGQIISRGSNGNGDYVRFGDGTQICWGGSAISGGVSTAAGTLFISATNTVTFPAAFSSTPSMGLGATSVTVWGAIDVTSTTAADMRLYRTGSTATNYTMRWIAVGRWF